MDSNQQEVANFLKIGQLASLQIASQSAGSIVGTIIAYNEIGIVMEDYRGGRGNFYPWSAVICVSPHGEKTN